MSADRLPPAHRPRFSRYDRPALSLADLMKPADGDFVDVAVWTMLNRRADAAQHAEMRAVLAAGGKPAVLAALQAQRADRDLPPIDGLARLLLVQGRTAVPVIGPYLARLAELIEANPALKAGLKAPGRLIGRVPRWLGWLGRRARRMGTRLGSRIRLPTPRRVRNALGVAHAPPDARLSPRAAALYAALCTAIDRRENPA